ncbi:hypothetical protein TWF132_008731 [Orbilia oligospora]|nr:hypothetical protein TWF132_008731 [Orbilia oligospora]
MLCRFTAGLGVPLRISNIIWKGPQKSERLNSWWLTRLITLNASTLKSLGMKVTPNNRESDVDLRRSEKPHRLPNLALPNLREFVVYWVADPYGIMQVYYLLRAARYLKELTVHISKIDDLLNLSTWLQYIKFIPRSPEYPEMDGITTIESFFELCFFSPLAETRLRKICFSRMLVLTVRSTEFLDTRDLKDLRLCLCENTTVFLSSLDLRGKLRLDTVIINGVCESLSGINSLLSTIQPGLRFLVYHVDIYSNIQGVLNPYDGSEFPFSRDIISRHRDTLRYLSHGVNYRNIIWFQPRSRPTTFSNPKHRCIDPSI